MLRNHEFWAKNEESGIPDHSRSNERSTKMDYKWNIIPHILPTQLRDN